MRTDRTAVLTLLACSLAAGYGCRPPAPPVLVSTIELVRVDSASNAEAPRTRADSLRLRAFQRAQSAALQVDTIVATPPELHLRVGDSLPFFRAMRFEARDRGGSTVRGFAPLLRAEPWSVVKLRGMYLVAVAPGRGVLLVQVGPGVAPRGPSSERPLTRVAITVDAP